LAQPASSLMPTAPPLHPSSTSSQRPPYGTPLLQPFPPPTPPASLTPAAHNDGRIISRDLVKDALQRLVQVSFTLQGRSCHFHPCIHSNTCLANRVTSSLIYSTGSCRMHIHRQLGIYEDSGCDKDERSAFVL
jgi:mRNA-decapping enzyme 1B